MSYVKQDWKDYPDTTTPINSQRLNHIEDGIAAALTSDNITTDMTSTDNNKVPNAKTIRQYVDGTLLWTNSSPTKSFSNQTISLSNLNYDYYKIIFKSKNDEDRWFTIELMANHTTLLTYNADNDSGLYTYLREVTSNSTGFVFGTARTVRYNSRSNDDERCIPMYIVGYNTGILGSVKNETK